MTIEKLPNTNVSFFGRFQVIISSCFSNHIRGRNGIKYLPLLDSMDDLKKDYPSCWHAQLIHFQTNLQSILMIRDILSDWLSVTYQDQSIRYPNYIQNLAMPWFWNLTNHLLELYMILSCFQFKAITCC